MVTANNYFFEIERIGVNNLPQTLKETHDYVVRATENGSNWDNYHNSEKIKRLIDLYFQKINEFASSKETKTPSGSKKTRQKKSAARPQRAAKSKPRIGRNVPVAKKADVQAKKVEHIREEVKYIKRFVALHNKVKSPNSILTLIKSLQRAIVQKLIRKTSPLANEIMAIQDKLINAYNKMNGDESFKIKEDELSKLVAIAGGEQVYPSINIIKRYIGLQGKTLDGDTIKRILKQIENALDKKKVAENDPYIDKVKTIYNALNKKSSGEKLSIAKAELNGLAGIVEGCSCKNDLGKIYKTNVKKIRSHKRIPYSHEIGGALNGVLTAEEMANRKLDLLNFFSFWLRLLGMPARNFTAMFHGEPHNGKTIFLLKLAQYLAENFGHVLYVSSEEFASPTMTKKVGEFLNPFPERLHFAENLKDPDLSQYDFVILDSVNDIGLKINDYKEMRKAYPDTAFIFILQHTKAGDFKGGKDWEHIAEIVGEVHRGVVTITKNRYSPKSSLNFFKQFGLQWQEPDDAATLKSLQLRGDMVTTDNSHY